MNALSDAPPKALLESPETRSSRESFDSLADQIDSGLRLTHTELCDLIAGINGAVVPQGIARKLREAKGHSADNISNLILQLEGKPLRGKEDGAAFP